MAQQNEASTQVAALEEHIKLLRNSIANGPPYCQGILPVHPKDLTLFYGTVGNLGKIELSAATPHEELQHLENACQPATFGVDQKDIYDETYRKAGKLNTEDFSLHFYATHAGLLDVVHSELAIDRLSKDGAIKAELYKLNVYRPGSFFKSHVDTPRSELQFGSLVIVFPTVHEGGELKIRHTGSEHTEENGNNPSLTRREWTFDSKALLADCTEPSIAYVAFFSDVEHEVLPVTSGYRVTITYNLYWSEASRSASTGSPTVPPQLSTTEETFRSTLRALLEDPTFLPEGGHLMFGLSHKYPLSSTKRRTEEAARKALRMVGTRLKGNDGVVLKVMQELSLPASLKTLYHMHDEYKKVPVACDYLIPLEEVNRVETPIDETLSKAWGGVLLSRPAHYIEGHSPPILPNVQWVTIAPRSTHLKTTFMAYGNEAAVGVIYWQLYLLVRVGPPGDRSGEPLGLAAYESRSHKRRKVGKRVQ
ncbi:hypothetical protein C8Q80DRAFT_1112915 [Daedaleopsis nitida]|nr:hypothetical protein C8Q80DRAFT_1112915 [Daedaleopsis nitida]